MLKRLVRDGYIEMDQKRQVSLTEAGYVAAEAVLRRHRLTERFLVDMLACSGTRCTKRPVVWNTLSQER